MTHFDSGCQTKLYWPLINKILNLLLSKIMDVTRVFASEELLTLRIVERNGLKIQSVLEFMRKVGVNSRDVRCRVLVPIIK